MPEAAPEGEGGRPEGADGAGAGRDQARELEVDVSQLMPLLLEGIRARRELGEDAANQWYANLPPQAQAQVNHDANALADAWLEMLNSLTTQILLDCKNAGMAPQDAGEYCRTILTYLGMSVSNFSARSSSLVTWDNNHGKPRYTFSRQALAMVWDYAEVNPFGPNGFMAVVEQMATALEKLPVTQKPGIVKQQAAQDATAQYQEADGGTEEAE